MLTADIQLLYAYQYWANERILAAADKVSEEQYRAPAAVSYGSLRGTLVHELSVEWLWRLRMEGDSPATGLAECDFLTVEALRERWRGEERAMRAFLSTLTDEDIQRTLSFRRANGVPGTQVLWHLLVHVVNHGTQTRAEAGILLAQYDQSPGDVDFALFLRERG